MIINKIYADNIKCNGCANTIKTALLKIDNIQDVEIDFENGLVTVASNQEIDKSIITAKLLKLGYPETDSNNNTLLQQAKSYISCAIGKIS
jgi:copper chaperone CopZ